MHDKMANVIERLLVRVLCLTALFSFSHSSVVVDGGVGSTSVSLLTDDDGGLASQVADLEAKVNKLAVWSEDHPFVRELTKRIDALELKAAQPTAELKMETLELKTDQQLQEIQSLKNTITEQGKELVQAKEKLDSLEKSLAEAAKESLQQKAEFDRKISALESSIGGVKRSIEDAESKLGKPINQTTSSLTQNMLKSISDAVAEVKRNASSSIDKLKSEVVIVKSALAQKESELKQLIRDGNESLRQSLTPKEKIYFNAQACSGDIYGSNKTVTYTWSTGRGINKNTGVFTSPRAGHYAFMFHGTKLSNDAAFSIIIDGQQENSVWTGTSSYKMVMGIAFSTVAYLKEGSTAYVKMHFGRLRAAIAGDYKIYYEGSDYVSSYDMTCLVTFSGFSVD